jgi:hypothetical protein
MNPGPVLATRTNRTADAESERWKHLPERPAVAFEYQPGPDAHNARSRAGRAMGFGFPLLTHLREEIRSSRRRFDGQFITKRSVVPDG